MLANYAAAIAPGALNPVPISCHVASLYWLFKDELKRDPVLADFTGPLYNPTNVIGQMLPYGRRITKPVFGNLALTAGSVIVFVQNQQPRHSCTASTANTVVGYNQTNWFTGLGVNHGFSQHNITEIRWRGGLSNKDDVQGNQGSWCQLIAVPEVAARAIIRQLCT
ncbi:MAG: hypothetical protein JWQ40_1896 [Segetibacter sp.]|nr:hypothetical protein [Segetibacter sp.]